MIYGYIRVSSDKQTVENQRFEILNICMTKECRVWTIKDGYRLGDDIQSKVLAFAFGLSAEMMRPAKYRVRRGR